MARASGWRGSGVCGRHTSTVWTSVVDMVTYLHEEGVGDASRRAASHPRVGVESARGYASKGSADKGGQEEMVVRESAGRRATARCGPPCDEAVGAVVPWCKVGAGGGGVSDTVAAPTSRGSWA